MIESNAIARAKIAIGTTIKFANKETAAIR
jgi:hypothetical protein